MLESENKNKPPKTRFRFKPGGWVGLDPFAPSQKKTIKKRSLTIVLFMITVFFVFLCCVFTHGTLMPKYCEGARSSPLGEREERVTVLVPIHETSVT